MKKRFILYKRRDLKTGLKFDIYDGDIENSGNCISILEEDVFVIEPVFYKVIDNYANYGHWGKHVLDHDKKNEMILELYEYAGFLVNKIEMEYYPGLNKNNFGKIYSDINKNRKKIILFINSISDWIKNTKNKFLTISGI